MEARLLHAALVAACLLSLGASHRSETSHRTENFLVTAPTPELSREIAEAAEQYRSSLALEWLGRELPPWSGPCPITVQVGRNLGAGGATSFMFERGRPFGWTMTIQGSRIRILDSVLPHEITHTIFATHFGRPLPRWADEGACTTVEHDSEKSKQKQMLIQFLTTRRGIAFNHMFAMKEYPRDIMPLYAQGYSLARYLIAHGGKRQFVNYVGDGMDWNDWTKATQTHYGFESLAELQVKWLDWVKNGSPPIQPIPTLIAAAAPSAAAGESGDAPPPSQVAVREAPPAAAARLASTGSWYSRTRDKTQAARALTAVSSSQFPAKTAVATAGQSVTRLQEPGRPKQTVIDWTNPPPARPTSPAAQPPQRPRSYLIRRDMIGGTVWR